MSARESGAGLEDSGQQTVIKIYLVNGESRSLRLDERTEVTVSPSPCRFVLPCQR